jgi:parallel beta-helix repeat protein
VLATSTGNIVQGNKIGTDISGTKALLNTDHGVSIQSATGTLIGGTAAGAGNLVSGNGAAEILVLGAQAANTIQGNLIGTDGTGTHALDVSNIGGGVSIQGSQNQLIGGTSPGARNVIANNLGDGVAVLASSAITIAGNYIGINLSGTKGLDNTGEGITISSSVGVTIGGTAPGAGNVVSSNDKGGILIDQASSAALVQGNLIGTDATRINPLSNFGDGVTIDYATHVTIGGTTPAARNVISGNGGDGIRITDFATTNFVLGNYIGTDAGGATKLGNLQDGVEVTDEAGNTTIGGATAAARNVISGNLGSGITLSVGSGVGNTVQGNFIGTDDSGTTALGNALYGVFISQSQANLIGGATPSVGSAAAAEQNVISGNQLGGVFIQGKFATGNTVEGNLIGTDVTGTRALGNFAGVSIASGATGNTIGGTTFSARNVIAGNLTDGLMIAGQGTSHTTVEGNLIGTDAAGTQPLGNALRGIFIQDASNNAITSNLVSGNGSDGILITDPSATGNLITGNRIGTDRSGTKAIGNGGNGISIIGAPANTIGGTTARAGNVVSGNTLNGVAISNLAAAPGQGTVIAGNVIGSDPTGTLPLGNGGDGVLLDTVTNHLVGGPTPAARNLIAANAQAGVEVRGGSANQIQGNAIGTNAAGTASLGNLYGVYVNGASTTLIGGTVAGAGNLISGNSTAQGSGIGVQILGAGATGNVVQGNYIGTDGGGTHAVPNNIGVFINDVSGNLVGGTTPGSGNLISGNVTGSPGKAGSSWCGWWSCRCRLRRRSCPGPWSASRPGRSR